MEKKPCPICNDSMVYMQRYPTRVCLECMNKTVTKDGDNIDFFNEGPEGGFYSIINNEKGDIHECYVDGKLCHAQEGRFGGIIVSLVDEKAS